MNRLIGIGSLLAGICGLSGGGRLGEEGVPSQGGDLAAQVGCGLLDPPGSVPGGLDEGVLDGVVDAGAEDVLEEVLALGGVGAQEPGELALRQDDRLRELLPA